MTLVFPKVQYWKTAHYMILENYKIQFSNIGISIGMISENCKLQSSNIGIDISTTLEN